MLDSTPPLETEIIDEITYTIKDLTLEYNSTKDEASKATNVLNSKATLNGMDDINKIVATAMKEIEIFTNNTKKPGIVVSISSKAIAIIDPNNKWAGKWIDNASDRVVEETLKESTIEEIADKVISSINQQREEVIDYMEAVVVIRTTLVDSQVYYTALLEKAKLLLPTIAIDTREELDTKSLINRLTKSVIQLDRMVTSNINPLIASAKLAIQKIDEELPDIEHDLKYNGSFKIAQQKLADYIGMAKTVKAMTEQAGDVIRQDIQRTTIESIKMVGEVIIDTNRMTRIQQEEDKHLETLNKIMASTSEKIDQSFDNVTNLHISYLESKQKHQHQLIAHYAKD
jgi:hypothetical protein